MRCCICISACSGATLSMLDNLRMEHVPYSLQGLLCSMSVAGPHRDREPARPLTLLPHPVLACMQSSWLPPFPPSLHPSHTPPPPSSVLDCMHRLQDAGLGLSASRPSSEAQSAYAALLEQGVSQLQLLGADPGGPTSSRKAHQAAQDRLYGLLEALAQVSATTWGLLLCVSVCLSVSLFVCLSLSLHFCAPTCLPPNIRLR